MHAIARVLAVAYLALAVVGGVVLVQTSLNYVRVAEINVTIDERVAVVAVDIQWNGSWSDTPVVKVRVNATNPGSLAIEVTSIDFMLHMDDPNDGLEWSDPAALAATEVAPGGVTKRRGQGFVIDPGASRSIQVNVTVLGPDQLGRFDRPDANGRYYPIVLGARFVYFFVGFDLFGVVDLVPYYALEGVVPSE